ncbi:MAG: hypothetical protein ACUVQ1_05985 [Candidatus Kapaibacteriales bacterium]
MTLKIIVRTAILGIISFLIIWGLNAQEQVENKDPKVIFVEAKCNTCHSVSSWEIVQKNKSANNKAPDLSQVKSEMDKESFKKYLLKEETLNNKKHPVAFKGSTEDLDALVSALLLLSQDANKNNQKDNQGNHQEQK